MADTHAWLSVQPETIRERLAAGAVVVALRRLVKSGLGRTCTIQVKLHAQSVEVCVYNAPIGNAVIPQGGDATE